MCRLYVHGVCNRLGGIAGNHFNGPYRVTEGVWHLSESQMPMASLETLCGNPAADDSLMESK